MTVASNNMIYFLCFIILICSGYLIWFSISVKRKGYSTIRDFLLEDKKRIFWLKKHGKSFIDRVRIWRRKRSLPWLRRSLKISWIKDIRVGYFIEILIIIIWAIFVGRAYLNLDRLVWPGGPEFASSIQTNYIWTNLPKCGTCVFWNGFIRGGSPAFADMQGSMLYPLVIIFTFIMGTLNGAKLTLIASLIMGGIAQWWLSKVMGFGRIPRIWGGLLAVVGAHLAGRMELGVVGVVLSTAACSLVIAPGIALGLTGKRRYSILLGITIGLALLSGQGYMQVGMILGIIPAFLIFLPGRQGKMKCIWKEYLLAGFLAFLIAGIFLIPMIHFYPNIVKETDPSFIVAQAFRFIPLNHLINDVNFYYNISLIPKPYPYLYTNFLGWIPIVLAILTLRFIPRSRFRLFLFFIVALILVYLTASADLLKFIMRFFPIAAAVRNSPQISGLANPLILGLSVWGLDAILKNKWPRIAFINSDTNHSIINIRGNTYLLILAIPLIWSIKEAYNFGQTWLVTTEIDASIYQKVEYLQTDQSEWINLPYGAHYWMIPALETNLKFSGGIRTWIWRERENPPINQEATFDAVELGATNFIREIDGLYYLSHYENEYAFIQSGDQKLACKAQAIGGNIDVDCPYSEKGQLFVYENNWTGWYAWVDQIETPLRLSVWLSVDAPAGKHTYQFRYRPWDVWLGILLTILGIMLCMMLWIRAKQTDNLSNDILISSLMAEDNP